MLNPVYPYAVAIRGTNYVVMDTRSGEVLRPAYITRDKAEKVCAERNANA